MVHWRQVENLRCIPKVKHYIGRICIFPHDILNDSVWSAGPLPYVDIIAAGQTGEIY